MKFKSYHRAKTVAEVSRLCATEDCIIFAGGTDIMVKGRERTVYASKTLVDIQDIPLLGSIEAHEGNIVIGAAVTLNALLSSDLVLQKVPLLREAVSHVANCQVRNRATLVGNIANACPASDCIPALMVLGAQVEINGPQAVRTVLLKDLFRENKACLRHRGMHVRTCFFPETTRHKLMLENGEMISSVSVPVQGADQRYFFRKLTRNRSSDMAILNCTMIADMNAEGSFGSLHVCLGGAFPSPRCFDEHDRTLVGRPFDNEDFERFAQAYGQFLEPEEKLLADYAYKRAVVPSIIREGLEQLSGLQMEASV
ncbi:MAG: FAD binding domain-containing protein [Spirochaetia bacterium]|jgi:carbon-monoxide dehydrogenase medium subunit|nr:FAD binding domain-containing protein [Spirochaetia bacterium]